MTTTDTRIINIGTQPRDDVHIAARLVADLDGQRRREQAAFLAGYEAGFDSGYEVGHAHAERDMDKAWKQTSRRIRAGAYSRTSAERRAAEREACKPRPGDFPGLDNDPHALDALKASATKNGNR